MYREREKECGYAPVFCPNSSVCGKMLRFVSHKYGAVTCNVHMYLCHGRNCRNTRRLVNISIALTTSTSEYRHTHTHTFFNVGRCIALSIIYGGPGPHFFSETAANYLLRLPITAVPIGDIPDPSISSAVEEVSGTAWAYFQLKYLMYLNFSYVAM